MLFEIALGVLSAMLVIMLAAWAIGMQFNLVAV